jgi:hypothetical protein
MFVCYSPETPLRSKNPKRIVQRILFFVFFFFSALPVFSQENPASAEIDALLLQRGELIAQSSDTRQTDRELFALGYRPTAVITRQVLESGAVRITFNAYQAIPEERKERYFQRLSATYPYLVSMEIDTEAQIVSFQLTAGSSAAEINSIVEHFGYLGHEEL